MPNAASARSTWSIDPARSEATFTVRSLPGIPIGGRVRAVTGTLLLDERVPANSTVTAVIPLDRVSFGRGSVRLALPPMRFQSTRVTEVATGHWQVAGSLTIQGVTRPVVLHTTDAGRDTDAAGRERGRLTAETTLSRAAFGLRGPAGFAPAGALFGDRVRIRLTIALLRED